MKYRKRMNVIGQNGSIYPAEQLSGDKYIVGKFIVIVEWDESCVRWQVVETVCRATKANIKAHAKAE